MARPRLNDTVRRAVPRRAFQASILLAWLAAATTALLFADLGGAVDLLAAGERPDTGRLAVMLGLVLLAAALAAVSAYFAARLSAVTEHNLRRSLVQQLFALGATATTRRSGGLLALTTESAEKVGHYRGAFLGPIVGAMTTPLVVLVVMAVTADPGIAWRLALLLLLVPIAVGGFQRVVSPIGAAYRTSQAGLTSGFLEAIQSLDTLVYARAAGRAAADLAARGERHRRSIMRMLLGNQLLILVVDAAFFLAVVVAATAMAASRIAAGTLSLGDGIAVVLMSLLVTGPVDVIGQFFYIGIAGRAAQHQISDYLSLPPSGGGAGDAAVPVDPGTLVVDDVAAGWPGGPDVLTHLSFRVKRGEKVALVGPSGAGKSTTAALLQANLLPRSGRVLVGGLDTAQADPAAIRAQLAVVEQRTFLFLGSVRDNLRVARPAATEPELWAALDLAELSDDVRAMPHGLDTPVGEHGRLLSGGQAQRLAIARAALRDAPILLLDEPTSQVDLAGEAAILRSLARLAQGRTVFMIAHRPGAILAADRVIELAGVEA